jgi:TolB-like protein/predicted Ser/Thr protein kinase
MIGQSILHYKILEKLGEGGMGVVYKAEDTKLRRIVSLKFIAPQIASNEEERAHFLQEARAVASLDHPNVCAIYEVGDANGQPYLAMAYIEGETLAQKIGLGPLPASRVIDFAAQIVEGLAEAHDTGIIHRDIKSANVMVTPKGQAKIMDFGVAEFVGRDARAGEVVGTASYMSPEQATGETVDVRTDIWSFGVVVHEMLCGRLPLQGDYEAAVLHSILNEKPPEIDNVDVPPALLEIISKCLRKEPEKRFRNGAELAAALRVLGSPKATAPIEVVAPTRGRRLAGPLGAVAAVLVVLAGLVFWRFGGGDTGAGRVAGERPSIVVLPLNNLSGTGDDDYFVDGMTDELITSLAKIKGLRVISRTSAMRLKEANRTVPEIAEQLGVDYVLEGSVLRADGRVRINTKLIDTAQDRSVWAENYDHPFEDILSLQNEAARTIAGEIRVQLSPEEQIRLAATPKISPQAYENYLRARFFMNRRSRESVARAKELFQEIIDAEPDSGMGYAGLADAHVLTAVQGHAPPQQVWPEAKAAAERAVELDANLAEAHASLGLIRSFYEWDWKNAAQEFDRAIELNPGYVTARQRRATYLSRLGRHDEAIEEIQRAREIDPLSLSVSHSAGVIYSMAREHNMAVEQFKNNLELASDYYRTYMALGRCQLETQDFTGGARFTQPGLRAFGA